MFFSFGVSRRIETCVSLSSLSHKTAYQYHLILKAQRAVNARMAGERLHRNINILRPACLCTQMDPKKNPSVHPHKIAHARGDHRSAGGSIHRSIHPRSLVVIQHDGDSPERSLPRGTMFPRFTKVSSVDGTARRTRILGLSLIHI